VNLVTVPVVVRNAHGEAVGTLRKEDFRLFDRGKLQTITRFSIEKADATPRPPTGRAGANGTSGQGISGAPAATAIAQRFLAWLFDDAHRRALRLSACWVAGGAFARNGKYVTGTEKTINLN
jgi:hypothetical protein